MKVSLVGEAGQCVAGGGHGCATNETFLLFPGGRSSSDLIHGNILSSLEIRTF